MNKIFGLVLATCAALPLAVFPASAQEGRSAEIVVKNLNVKRTAFSKKAIRKAVPAQRARTIRPTIDPGDIIIEGEVPLPGPRTLDAPAAVGEGPGNGSDELGYLPYTMARVEKNTLFGGGSGYQKTYAPVGKVFATLGGKNVWCTGTLIKPGVVVTAAHCVSKFGAGYNASAFASYAEFRAGFTGPAALDSPHGAWKVKQIHVPSPYIEGTDAPLVIYGGGQSIVAYDLYANDLALLVLEAQNNKQLGEKTGYYQYGVTHEQVIKSAYYANKYVAHVTALGYSPLLDGGNALLRNDSTAFWIASDDVHFSYLHAGSGFDEGASGGPWIVNFGKAPKPTPPFKLGAKSGQRVIGVHQGTIVGMGPEDLDNPYKQAQATSFGVNMWYPELAYGTYGAGNIGSLMQSVCSKAGNKAACGIWPF